MVEVIKDYTSKRLDLIKLEATEKSAKATGNLVFYGMLIFFSMLLIVFSFIGFGIWLGMYLGNYSYGFLSMAGFILFLLMMLWIFKNSIISTVVNKVIGLIYTNEEK